MSPTDGALDELEAAQRQLRVACRELDAEGLRRAMERRGAALVQLKARLGRWTAVQQAAVRDAILVDAREIEQLVRAAQGRIAEELHRLTDGARALRSYAIPRGASSALDRSG